MDLSDGLLAGGGLGAIIVAAIVEAARRLAALAASMLRFVEQAQSLADRLEKTAVQASGALEDMAEAATETRAMAEGANAHFARMAEVADVVEAALGAWAPESDDRRDRRAVTSRNPGQARKGVTK